MYKKWRHRKKIIFSIFQIETHTFGFIGLISWNLRSIEIIAGEEWYNNIAARDESSLISCSLLNPLFNCTVQTLRGNGTIESPGNEKAESLHHSHTVWHTVWMGKNAPETEIRSRSSTLVSLVAQQWSAELVRGRHRARGLTYGTGTQWHSADTLG